jgi:hypothetical protein
LTDLLHSQRLRKPAHLSRQDPQTDDDEAAHCCGRAGADESIPKAKFVDRDAKPDHH